MCVSAVLGVAESPAKGTRLLLQQAPLPWEQQDDRPHYKETLGVSGLAQRGSSVGRWSQTQVV